MTEELIVKHGVARFVTPKEGYSIPGTVQISIDGHALSKAYDGNEAAFKRDVYEMCMKYQLSGHILRRGMKMHNINFLKLRKASNFDEAYVRAEYESFIKKANETDSGDRVLQEAPRRSRLEGGGNTIP